MFPPGMPSAASISSGPITSMHSGDSRQSAIGSASTLSSDASVASNAWCSAPAGSWRNSRAGWCSPNSVNVCAPAAARSSPRMLRSVSEWQYTSHGVTAGMRPAAASAWATSSWR